MPFFDNILFASPLLPASAQPAAQQIQPDQQPCNGKRPKKNGSRTRKRTEFPLPAFAGFKLIQAVKLLRVRKQLIQVGVINGLLPARALADILDKMTGRITQGGGPVEHRRDKCILRMVKNQLGSINLHLIVFIVILSGRGKIRLIFTALPGL